MHLRPLDPEIDIPAVVALLNTYNSDPITTEQYTGWLERNPPGRDIRRWVAVDENGKVIGLNTANHETWNPPGKYDVWAVVDPGLRGKGIGTALFADAIDYARGRGANVFSSEVRETDPASLAFARRFGFEIDRHQFESSLDLTAFDEAPFQGVVESVAASGIRIHSLAELGNTRENRRKLHAVNHATVLDIPGSSGEWMDFEQFDQMVTKAEWFKPEGQFGALDGDEWVGLSAVQMLAETQGAYNLMTGVMPSYRGRGIAQALKLAVIRYARARGAGYMRTNNDSQNAPMLAVNRKLGYAPLPGTYLLIRKFTE